MYTNIHIFYKFRVQLSYEIFIFNIRIFIPHFRYYRYIFTSYANNSFYNFHSILLYKIFSKICRKIKKFKNIQKTFWNIYRRQKNGCLEKSFAIINGYSDDNYFIYICKIFNFKNCNDIDASIHLLLFYLCYKKFIKISTNKSAYFFYVETFKLFVKTLL